MKTIITIILLAATTIMVQAQCVTTINLSTNISCNGLCDGDATATPVGVPPYNYLWTPGNMTTSSVSGLCVGTYTVNVVDGASCVSSATVAITEPAVLTATSTQTNASCGGTCDGSITAFPSGGTSPYTHEWTSSPVQTGATATGLCAGTYNDTITDANGCVFVLGPITITEPTPVTVSIIGGGIPCNGGNSGYATATASGGVPSVISGYLYSWSTSPSQTTATATGLSAGTYTCTVTDSLGCTGTNSFTLTEPAVFTYSATSTNASCSNCCDGSASASPTGGTSPYTYVWSNGASVQSISALCPGNYTVCVTDANGCTSPCVNVSVNFTIGIDEINSESEVSVFPNPSTGKFHLNLLQSNNCIIKIVNPMGETILEDTKINSAKTEIDLSAQPSGIYFIEIISPVGTCMKKMILNK